MRTRPTSAPGLAGRRKTTGLDGGTALHREPEYPYDEGGAAGIQSWSLIPDTVRDGWRRHLRFRVLDCYCTEPYLLVRRGERPCAWTCLMILEERRSWWRAWSGEVREALPEVVRFVPGRVTLPSWWKATRTGRRAWPGGWSGRMAVLIQCARLGPRSWVTPGVLSTSPRLRYITFSALYTAQGIPEGLTFFAIPAWLALNNVSAAAIGGYLARSKPWSFKLFAGPLMDRWSYRPWAGRPVGAVRAGGAGAQFPVHDVDPDPVNNILGLSITGLHRELLWGVPGRGHRWHGGGHHPRGTAVARQRPDVGAKVLGTSASLTTGTWLTTTWGSATRWCGCP